MSSNHEQQSQQPAEPGGPESPHGNVNTVKTERSGPALVVTIDRPQVRNAVDSPTAVALVQTFRAGSCAFRCDTHWRGQHLLFRLRSHGYAGSSAGIARC